MRYRTLRSSVSSRPGGVLGTSVGVAGLPSTRNAIGAPRGQPGIASGPTTERMYPLKSCVERTDATPHRVRPTYASTRVPAGSSRRSAPNAPPSNCATRGVAPSGFADEYFASSDIVPPAAGQATVLVL